MVDAVTSLVAQTSLTIRETTKVTNTSRTSSAVQSTSQSGISAAVISALTTAPTNSEITTRLQQADDILTQRLETAVSTDEISQFQELRQRIRDAIVDDVTYTGLELLSEFSYQLGLAPDASGSTSQPTTVDIEDVREQRQLRGEYAADALREQVDYDQRTSDIVSDQRKDEVAFREKIANQEKYEDDYDRIIDKEREEQRRFIEGQIADAYASPDPLENDRVVDYYG